MRVCLHCTHTYAQLLSWIDLLISLFDARRHHRAELWHQRCEHPRRPSLSHTLSSFSFKCNKSFPSTLHACRLWKHVRLPFQDSNSRASFPFALVHCDASTSPVTSISGYQYYLVIILDDYSHFTWTFLLRHKSDLRSHLVKFHDYVSMQFQRPIAGLQTG
jgi:hypothetical protein